MDFLPKRFREAFGFEGTPDAAVFKRWTAFGLLGSHSRFHGSQSYRVPWMFDEEAVDVTRTFTRLKMRLMPYLFQLGSEATRTGAPIMRPMVLEFPDDPGAGYLDRQYMLGSDILVAPVFTESGEVDFYLPSGTWTHLLTGETLEGGPDYDYLDGLTLRVFPGGTGTVDVTVTTPDGRAEKFSVDRAEVTE
jgi:alpha-D-xyloside xylohydrolase